MISVQVLRTYCGRKEDMRDSNCIFCKIANGEIPSGTIYEDEKFRVILDLGPATRGHALILPKEHYANLFEMPEELAADAMKLAKRIAELQKNRLHADGLNLVQNNGASAGQTVEHFHIHLIPRNNEDHVGVTWTPGKLTEEDKNEILEKISKIQMN